MLLYNKKRLIVMEVDINELRPSFQHRNHCADYVTLLQSIEPRYPIERTISAQLQRDLTVDDLTR